MLKLLTAIMLTASLTGQPAYITKVETSEIPPVILQGDDETSEKEAADQEKNVLAITFKNDGIDSSAANGIEIEGTTLTITKPGNYTITGECSDGKIVVKDNLESLNITFKDLKLSKKDSSPLIIGKSSNVLISSEGDTILTVINTKEQEQTKEPLYELAEPTKEDQEAELGEASPESITEGSVDPEAKGEASNSTSEGETSEDPKTAWENFLSIYGLEDKKIAEESGTTVKDTEDKTQTNQETDKNIAPVIKVGTNATATFQNSDGSIKLDASEADDGIKGESQSQIYVQGNLDIMAAGDGIESESDVTIVGNVTINSAVGNGISASMINISDGSTEIAAGYDADPLNPGDSTALKSTGNIEISGGSLSLNASDDGISAEKDIDISEGSMEIAAGDDAIHADYKVTIGSESTTPSVQITNSNEGIEGAEVTVNSGEINVKSLDDGINAANKNLDGYDYKIEINGGQIYVDADSDALDSNGSVLVNGGSVTVYGAAEGDGNAVDFGDLDTDKFEINGGQVIAIGQNAMARKPTSGNYVSFGVEDNMKVDIKAGDTVRILDQDGNEVVIIEAAKAGNCIIYSGETIDMDQKYTLEINGTAVEGGTEEEQPKPEEKPSEGEKPNVPDAKPEGDKKPEDKPAEQKPADQNKPAEGKSDTKTNTETKPAEQQNQNQQAQQQQNQQQQQVQEQVQKINVKGILKVTSMINGSPAAVRISILGDGQVVKQTNVAFKDNTAFEFADLPVSANGKNISYSMQVAGHSLYDFVVTQNADGTYVITATPINASKAKSTQTGIQKYTIPAIIIGGLAGVGVYFLRRKKK